ncbi:hypothetical protein ACFWZW_07070 [Microbacterium enclense]|uniref:hypothetical protein n=1 Tax=Microbacterium enclense TaxID=993073 RepID=UPI0036DC5930
MRALTSEREGQDALSVLTPGPVVGRLAWVGFRAGLSLVPLLFAFAGFMSIVDGR